VQATLDKSFAASIGLAGDATGPIEVQIGDLDLRTPSATINDLNGQPTVG